MTTLSYDEWKSERGFVENNDNILHLTEQKYDKDVREVIEDFLKEKYQEYLSQAQGV